MSVVRVIDIMAQSEESWEDATRHAVAEASQVYPDILSLRVNRLEAVVEQDEVTFFRVKLKVAHVLDTDGAGEDDQGEENFEDEDEFGPEQSFGDDQREMATQSYGDEYEEESPGRNYAGPTGQNSGFGGDDDEQMRQRGGGASGTRRGPSGDDQQFAGGGSRGGQRSPQAEPEVAGRGVSQPGRSAQDAGQTRGRGSQPQQQMGSPQRRSRGGSGPTNPQSRRRSGQPAYD
jgi:dodecin